jgi:hypothetical protein
LISLRNGFAQYHLATLNSAKFPKTPSHLPFPPRQRKYTRSQYFELNVIHAGMNNIQRFYYDSSDL